MTTRTTPRGLKALPHGIDITALGGIDALIDFHRATFGDARMETDGADDDQDGDGDEGDGQERQRGAENSGEDQDDGARRALAAERREAKQAKRDLAAAQARVKELEDAGKSEEQRREDAAKSLQSENSDLKAQVEAKDGLLLRYEVAAAKGLDLTAAKRLQGSSREEVEADADDWIQHWGPGTGSSGQDERRGDRGQGARSGQKESSFAQGAARARARWGDKQ